MTPFTFPFSAPISLDEKEVEVNPPVSGRRVSVTSRLSVLPAVGYTPRSRSRSHSSNGSGSTLSPDTRKSNWRSKLRQPHPFLSREANNYPNPTPPASDSAIEEKPQDGRFKVFSVKDILLLVALTLSLGVFILGCVQSHNITSAVNKEIKTINTIPANLTGIGGESAVPATASVGKPAAKPAAKNGELFLRDLGAHVELDVRKDSTATTTTTTTKPSPATPTTAPGNAQRNDTGKSNLGPFVTATPTFGKNQDPTSMNMTSIPLIENDAMYLKAHRKLAMTSLVFYTNAMPFVSIIYTSIELIIVLLIATSTIRLRRCSSDSVDDFDFDSDAETISGEEDEKWKHIGPLATELVEEKPTAFEKWQTHMPLLSVVASCIILAGWIAVIAVQSHCELTPQGFKAEVCPVLMRRSSAHVNDISIVRSVFSWIIVICYLAFIAITIVSSKIFSRAKRQRSSSVNINNIKRVMSPPGSKKPILKTRARSASLRRKTVRFSFEHEAAATRQDFGDDGVQYIAAPCEVEDRTSDELRTPWQWQGGFVNDSHHESKSNERNLTAVAGAYGRNASKVSQAMALSSNPTRPFRKGRLPVSVYNINTKLADQPLAATTHEQRGGSFDLGLSSIRRSSRLSTTMRERASLDERRSRSITRIGSTTPNLSRQDSTVSAMTNGRRSVDVNKRVSRIDEEGKVSPL